MPIDTAENRQAVMPLALKPADLTQALIPHTWRPLAPDEMHSYPRIDHSAHNSYPRAENLKGFMLDVKHFASQSHGGPSSIKEYDAIVAGPPEGVIGIHLKPARYGMFRQWNPCKPRQPPADAAN